MFGHDKIHFHLNLLLQVQFQKCSALAFAYFADTPGQVDAPGVTVKQKSHRRSCG
jgi:hypothetical protein